MKRLIPLLLLPVLLFGSDEFAYDDLCRDLEILRRYNAKYMRLYPTTYNLFAQGGYLMMPSARMGESGEMGIGFSSIPPYYNFNARCQLVSHLELSGSYRVFKGVDDPLLSPYGFGDFADKGINFKFALFRPEDSNYKVPGLAIGWDDFLGTRAFESQYIVATHVFYPIGLELSLGYGRHRIKGFFGGALWTPFWGTCNSFLEGISLTAEWDGIDYPKDPHPRGRSQKWPVNLGFKYRFYDYIDLTVAQVRGNKLALGAQAWYNFGTMEGFLPKCHDKLPYTAPVNFEPLGAWRPESLFVSELSASLSAQGLPLLDLYLYYDKCDDKVLRVVFHNVKYRSQCEIRRRLTSLFGSLLPADIDRVIAVHYSEGFSIEEFVFEGSILRQYQSNEIGDYEMAILSPLREVTLIDSDCPTRLFGERLHSFEAYLLPRTHFYFGSSRGKFKYAAGATLEMDGYATPWDIFWRMRLGYLLFSYLDECSDVDILNPSQLINVHTDIVNYDKQRGLRIDELYLQKNLAIGYGWFARGSLGYFDEMYGGVAGELLWYPVSSPFAAGLSGACLFRRDLKGLGFTNTIRKLNGFIPTYVPFIGSQFFLNLHYDWQAAGATFSASTGKFLANDWGVRLEAARYFSSGLRIFFWYTFTNGNDKVNGHTYFDKGVGFSMPLDIFFTCSSTSRFGYAMSAWLRDVGYEAPTGRPLYDLLYLERQ